MWKITSQNVVLVSVVLHIFNLKKRAGNNCMGLKWSKFEQLHPQKLALVHSVSPTNVEFEKRGHNNCNTIIGSKWSKCEKWHPQNLALVHSVVQQFWIWKQRPV